MVLSDRAKLTWLRIYYWVTPLFFVADAVWGMSVRASFLPRLDQRVAYYLFCLACAAVCQWQPTAAPVVGMAESAVNLFLLLLSVLLPIWQLDPSLLGGESTLSLASPARLINVMLSGGMLIVSFQRNQAALAKRWLRG